MSFGQLYWSLIWNLVTTISRDTTFLNANDWTSSGFPIRKGIACEMSIMYGSPRGVDCGQ